MRAPLRQRLASAPAPARTLGRTHSRAASRTRASCRPAGAARRGGRLRGERGRLCMRARAAPRRQGARSEGRSIGARCAAPPAPTRAAGASTAPAVHHRWCAAPRREKLGHAATRRGRSRARAQIHPATALEPDRGAPAAAAAGAQEPGAREPIADSRREPIALNAVPLGCAYAVHQGQNEEHAIETSPIGRAVCEQLRSNPCHTWLLGCFWTLDPLNQNAAPGAGRDAKGG